MEVDICIQNCSLSNMKVDTEVDICIRFVTFVQLSNMEVNIMIWILFFSNTNYEGRHFDFL